MKILVPIKRTHDPDTRIRLKDDGTIDTTNIKWVINTFDEIAVEEALRKKEKYGGEVVVVTIGTPDWIDQIRTALAMGADRGILVDTGGKYLDQRAIAKVLVKIVEKENPNFVIMGKQAIDDDSNQVGQMLAGFLGWPQATFAYKVELSDDLKKATVIREVDGGLETVEVDLPAVITTDLRLNQPRFASLPEIMRAKRKPVEQIKLEDLGVDVEPVLTIEKLEPPPKRKAGVIVKDVDELIEKLDKEAKVLPF